MAPAVINLLSSPEALNNRPSKAPAPTPPPRSSPRRHAAAAAIARLKSSTKKQDRQDDFGSDPFGSDPFASSPAISKPVTTTSSAVLQDAIGRETLDGISHDKPTSFLYDDMNDPFASSPFALINNRKSDTEAYKCLDLSEEIVARPRPGHEITPGPSGKDNSDGIFRQTVTVRDEENANSCLPPITASGNRSMTSQHVAMKGHNDFVFLSDDFDTTVDLGSSVAKVKDSIRKRSRSPQNLPTEGNKKAKVLDTVSTVHSKPVPGLRKASSDTLAKSPKKKVASFKHFKSTLEDDPILFTSSPDLVRARKDKSIARTTELPDMIISSSAPTPARSRTRQDKSQILTLSSDDDLPALGNIKPQPEKKLKRVNSKTALAEYNKSKAKTERATEKATEKSEKAQARDAERERKRLEKETKLREKQLASEVAKVNTLKTDKKTSSPEMLIDLPPGLDKKLYNQLVVFLGPLGIAVHEGVLSPSTKNIIQFRRKIEATYDSEAGHWLPCPKHIKKEPHIITLLSAQEFVDLSTNPEGADLDSHILRLKASYSDCAIIYLIDGLTAWMRKNRNVKNKAYTDAVRAQDVPTTIPESIVSVARRKRKEREYVDEDMIEDSLLKLQVVHGALIHHSTSMIDTAQWIVAFTQHISTIPYRHQKQSLPTSFCIDSGQIKTGDTPADTFTKMLQEINRITPSIAYGIAAEYPSATKLFKAFRENEEGGKAKDLLRGVRKSANRDGAFSDKEVGQSISRRVWKIWMGVDEGSIEV